MNKYIKQAKQDEIETLLDGRFYIRFAIVVTGIIIPASLIWNYVQFLNH